MSSDGGFNLGMTLALLDQPEIERISIVINGKCFKGKNVRKDLSSATFKEVEGNDQLPFDYFQLIPTGGTIDSENNSLDEVIGAKNSRIPEFLRDQVRTQIPFDTITPFMKDSRDITTEDLNILAKVVSESKASHLLITAGIYRIREIASILQQYLHPQDGKRVVITGSRNPLGTSDTTDASFSLGFAYGKLGFVSPGVHIVVNGKILQPHEDIMDMYTVEEKQIIRDQEEFRRMKQQQQR